jgi:putative ABC transport system permease protein
VLSLPEGDRVVSIVNLDAATTNNEPRVMHDFARWRELTSLEDTGSVTVGRTLFAEGRQPETVTVAEMSSSGFRVARVPPLLGRFLLAEDERAGAPDVVVIGHDVWLRRFAADPGIVGRDIRLGRTTYSVVGVMTEGFGFPVRRS